MLLPEDHLAVQDAIRAFVQAEIAPHAAAWDKNHHFPAAELKGLAELGCYGVAVPTEYDGAGLDYLALSLILEEIAAGDGGTSTVVSVNNCPVCSILMAFANDEQKERFLKPLARGDMRAWVAMRRRPAGVRYRRRRQSGWWSTKLRTRRLARSPSASALACGSSLARWLPTR